MTDAFGERTMKDTRDSRAYLSNVTAASPLHPSELDERVACVT